MITVQINNTVLQFGICKDDDIKWHVGPNGNGMNI